MQEEVDIGVVDRASGIGFEDGGRNANGGGGVGKKRRWRGKRT